MARRKRSALGAAPRRKAQRSADRSGFAAFRIVPAAGLFGMSSRVAYGIGMQPNTECRSMSRDVAKPQRK